MRVIALVVLAVAWYGCSTASDEENEKAIRAALEQQAAAWNQGDIDGYMSGYWRSDSTVFVSGGTSTTGFDSVLARYRRGYARREQMGTLDFEDVRVRMVQKQIGVATGVWRLNRIADAPWGRFTLLVEKKAAGWRVTYDHTSVGK